MLNARAMLGTHDVVWIVLDTLRYDVAQAELQAGHTPNLARLLPGGRWELRHTPASFTYPAHQAFFAGFLPTPAAPGPHPRLFALSFPGSETIAPETCVFDAPDVVSGFANAGYHTLCVGGVGFFNMRTPLSRVLPALFQEAHWRESFGVTAPASTENQVAFIAQRLRDVDPARRLFLFLNVSALHQPNRHYLPGQTQDSLHTHAAALRYVDGALGPLIDALRRPTLLVICSDHGTTYGDDGYSGHRLAHKSVWEVPYAELELTP